MAFGPADSFKRPPGFSLPPGFSTPPGFTPISIMRGTAEAGFSPPSDFGFTVASLTGEVARMWVEASGAEAVFDIRSGSEAGTVYQDSPAMVPNGPQINRLRVFSSGASMRFHSSGQSLSSWAAANDGTGTEPDLSFHFFQSATNTVQRRLLDRSGAGGGFINWSNNSGELATFFGALLTADTKVLIVLAESS